VYLFVGFGLWRSAFFAQLFFSTTAKTKSQRPQGQKISRTKTARDFRKVQKLSASSSDASELFSGLFYVPQVALTHHVVIAAYTLAGWECQQGRTQGRTQRILVAKRREEGGQT